MLLGVKSVIRIFFIRSGLDYQVDVTYHMIGHWGGRGGGGLRNNKQVILPSISKLQPIKNMYEI
jgi:hypothetical protein